MFGLEHRVGRLLEIRVTGLLRVEDLAAFRMSVAAAMSQAAGRVVVCTDLRAMDLLAAEVFDAVTLMLRANTPKIARHAILVSTAPVMALQLQRLVEEGGSPVRRVFRQVNEASEWLAKVLTPEETERMRAFLTPTW